MYRMTPRIQISVVLEWATCCNIDRFTHYPPRSIRNPSLAISLPCWRLWSTHPGEPRCPPGRKARSTRSINSGMLSRVTRRAPVRRLIRIVTLLSFVICVGVHAAENGAPAAALISCDRPCLKSFADAYFAALLSHSTATLLLDGHVRMTENTIPIPVGEGVMWRALSKPPDHFRIDVIDVVSQQIAVGSVLEIGGRTNLAALRLKVKSRRIVEIEQLFTGMIQPVALPNLKQPRAALLSDVPPERRNTRGQMQLIAESYFDALTSEDSRRAPFAADCIRHETGIQTTANKAPLDLELPANTPAEARERMTRLMRGMSVLTCPAQIDSGLFADLWK